PALPDLALPLTRSAQFALQDEALLSLLGEYLFLRQASGALACRTAADGKLCWARDVPEVSWVARHGDVIVAAGPRGAHGLRLTDGGPLWRFDGDALSGFKLAAGRLFVPHGERGLSAIDVETGQVLWSHWAPGARLQLPDSGRFSPWFHAGRER